MHSPKGRELAKRQAHIESRASHDGKRPEVATLGGTHSEILATRARTPDQARFEDLFLYLITEIDAPLPVIQLHSAHPVIYGECPIAAQAAIASPRGSAS